MFQYPQEALTATLLLALYLLRRSFTCLGWTLAFLFILVDDSLSLHERFTRAFDAATSFAPVLGLETQLYAAAILWAGVGLGLLCILGLGYHRNGATRAFSLRLCYLLLAPFSLVG